MGYSVEEFAELLGLKKPTYYGYESSKRRTPPHVLAEARAAQKRDKKFFKELPKRIDTALAWNAVPNECRAGEW
jgi:transcriptional regulator with XRE-family HTH domain